MIKKGDTIKIKREYLEAGEESIVYTAITDMEKGRVDATDSLTESWYPRPIHTFHAIHLENS